MDELLVLETVVGRIELDGRFLTINDEVYYLSERERQVMVFFLRHPNQVYTRRQITNVVFGPHYTVSNVAVYLRGIRRKIANSRVIRTIWGGSVSSGMILLTDLKKEEALDKLYDMDGRRKR